MNKFTSKSAIVAGLFVAAFAIATTASAYTFSANLKQGSTGADVQALQVVLNSDAATQVSVSGAGAPGSETTYFGAATKAAVIKFQNKYASEVLTPAGLTSGTGFVGALTRAKLNTMGGTVTTTTSTIPGCLPGYAFSPLTAQACGTTTTTTPVTTTTQSGPVTAALAQDNPAASAVVAGQATADLAHFTFTGNGTISRVEFQRIGISSNTTLSNVYLYQGNTRVSDGASVNTTGGVIFSGLSLAVSGSVTLSVKADILADTQGQLVGVQLTSFTTTGSSAATTASISGNIMTVASATFADVLVGTQTVATANVDAGTLGYSFWSAPVTVSTRAVSLKGANFKYIGSAPSDALANIKLYVNGTAVGSNGVVNASTQIISFDFASSPVTLNTGSATVEVRADVVKGSNRTVQLSLQNTADLIVMDSQLGVNVSMRTGGTHAAPSFSSTLASAGTITINVGSVSTTVDTTFNGLTTVTSGSTGATIAKFSVKAYGEDIKVSTITIEPILAGQSAVAATGVNNVALFYNGAQVGSSVSNILSGVDTAFNLGSSMILAAGQTATLEVRADLQGTGAANYTDGTVSANLIIGASNGQGQNSSSMVNVPTAAVTGNSLTIAAGSLSVAQSAGYSGAQTVNPNTSNVKLGSYILSNPSASEGVRITNLAVALTTTGVLTNLSNLRTTETSGSGATPINPSAANNFSVNFTLAPGQTKTIDIMADLGAATSSSTYTSTLRPTAVGASSNATLTPASATNGQTLTVLTGSVSAAPTLNPSPASLSAQFVVGGSQNLSAASYNFVATNGTATISELKFLVSGGTIAATSTPVTQVCVGGVCAPVVNNVAHLTGLAVVIPAGAGGANVVVQASLSTVGTNGILSNTTAILNLTFMKYTIGGVTTSTPVGSAQTFATDPSGTTPVAGAESALTIVAGATPAKVGMVLSTVGATSSPATLVGGLGTITAVASATSVTVLWATTTAAFGTGNISFLAVPSNTLTMVATKPTVTIADSSDSLINGLVKLAEITVAADANGALKLVDLPISMTSTGVTRVASGTAAFTVKGTDGTTITSTNGNFTMSAGGTATTTITLGTGYTISAGTSKTFRIYGTATDVSGAVNTTSVSTKLGAANLLLWNDVDGGVSNITGTLIYNYPTDTSVITNN
ncbi:MAG: hypothetical protein WC791_02590 [Candidatus Paceibacterota bacterium]|jgi:hypothetical protein